MTLYLVLGGVAAVLLGIWLGMPGRYESDRFRHRRSGPERDGVHNRRHLAELESALGRRGQSKTAKRHFTLLEGLSRAQKRASTTRRSGQSRFRTAVPDPAPRSSAGTAGSRASGPASGDPAKSRKPPINRAEE